MMKNATEKEKHSECKTARKRAPRNPSARRQQIISAAADLIAQEGSHKITNRSVAERAGVPLGSTTQYFKSVDDLRRAGLIELSARIEAEYDEAFHVMEHEEDVCASISNAICDYISNPERMRADATLYAAAIEDPAVRDIAKSSYDRFVDRCKPYMDLKRAKILFAFVEGALIDSCVMGHPYERELIQEAVALILDTPLDPAV